MVFDSILSTYLRSKFKYSGDFLIEYVKSPTGEFFKLFMPWIMTQDSTYLPSCWVEECHQMEDISRFYQKRNMFILETNVILHIKLEVCSILKKTVHDSHIVPVFYVVLRLPDV
jgi:hypothetical protein